MSAPDEFRYPFELEEFSALMFAHVDLALRIGEALCSARGNLSRRKVGEMLMGHAAALRQNPGFPNGAVGVYMAEMLEVWGSQRFGVPVPPLPE